MKSRLSEHFDPEVFNSSYIPTEFSPYVKNQVNNILKHGIDDQAVSRVGVEAITIDGEQSLDLDDAIRAERTKDGYCLWIHIADFAEAIPLFSPIDREALQRTTSIYRRDNIINMIPDELANDFLSLNMNGEKYTMTLQIDLDNQGKRKNISVYESKFRNMKRYTYEGFGEDYDNKDSEHHETLHLFNEISDILRANRMQNGASPYYKDEDRLVYLGSEKPIIKGSNNGKISHTIIEALMVEANTTIGEYLAERGEDGIYRQHLGMEERAFYTNKPGGHFGLGVNNYIHFTSPIRRYMDVVVHRILKAMNRGEERPYRKPDLSFIADHGNNTRLKIETVGLHIDYEYKGEQYLEKTKNRLGRQPEVFEMKGFIRNNVDKKRNMPQCMKEAMIDKIRNSHISTRAWVIGVILFGKDVDLKIFLKEKLLNDYDVKPGAILNLITQTQIIKGGGTMFELRETEEHNKFTVEIYLHGEKLSEHSMEYGKKGMRYEKGMSRLVVIEEVFDYFINL